jgi:hypothetical protein
MRDCSPPAAPRRRYGDVVRLLLDAPLRPDSGDRLRTLASGLEVVDVSSNPAFDIDALSDPQVEVIVGPRAPAGATLQFLDDLVIENVRRYVAGEPLLNRVDPGRGY